VNDRRAETEMTGTGQPFEVLRRFLDRGPQKRAGEVCEMCAAPIAEEHFHMVNLETRNLLCTCRACSLLFVPHGAAQGKFRAVPDRYAYAPSFMLTDSQWDALQIPVRLAFFFFNSSLGRVAAFYPSPAGATESLLPLETWQELIDANMLLKTLEPDVEALLVYRRKGENSFECFIVPIDACYELTGSVKRRWKGFDGGEEAWREIEAFFTKIRMKSKTVTA
jgi:hypothetical protein